MNEEKGRLTLRVPHSAHHWDTREFLEHLLEVFHNDFMTLSIRWRGHIHSERFVALKGVLPEANNWELVQHNTYKLTWRNQHRSRVSYQKTTTLGHLFLDHPRQSTEVCITCQHMHTTELLPLFFLLPSVGDLYERLKLATLF